MDRGFESRVEASMDASNYKILAGFSCFLVELYLSYYILLDVAILTAKAVQYIVCFSTGYRGVLSKSGHKLLAL
jgi:hypothetical protein